MTIDLKSFVAGMEVPRQSVPAERPQVSTQQQPAQQSEDA